MPAKQVKFYEFDDKRPISCDCGWSGEAGQGNREEYRQLYDISCPRCDRMLLIVPYPTHEETRVAAAAGHPQAKADLGMVEQRESFLARAERQKLTADSELPDLDDDEIVIEWDFEEPAEQDEHRDGWTVLRQGDREIWRELALFEGYERFGEVLEILRARYGARLVDLRPTRESLYYLLGDNLRAAGTVRALRESLRNGG